MTYAQLVAEHGAELGEAMFWCAVLSGEAVFEAPLSEHDAVAPWGRKSYLIGTGANDLG